MAQIDVPHVWEKSSYIRPIGTVFGGIRAYTHLAEIRPPNLKPCRAYVKHFPPQAHRALFNEWIGYTLMRAMGVPQPESALMPAPVQALPGTPMAWGFVSCQPSPKFEGTPAQLYNLADKTQCAALVKRLLSCTAIPLLIAADQLIKNADRNAGNLVFTSKTAFVAIDHSDILGGPAWEMAETHFTQQWAWSRLIEELTSIDSLKDDTKSAILASAQLVSEWYFELQTDLAAVMGAKTNTDVNASLAMVWWRALELEKWFKDKLGLIA